MSITKTKNTEFPILIVDDEHLTLRAYQMLLNGAGHENIITCGRIAEALTILEQQQVSVLILDIFMPGIKGDQILEKVVTTYPEIPVIMVTAANDVDMVVTCMKKGAFDYIVKPVDKERFLSVIGHALDLHKLRIENTLLRSKIQSRNLEHPDYFYDIVTQNKTMHSLFKYIESISVTNQPVLITGETGIGKELIAMSIHRASGRTGKYVAVNVAGLDDNAFSDTLFGHQKGAFTGAEKDRKGLIFQAKGGTLFLDEIGDLCEPSQVKLLRLIREKQFYPLGSDTVQISDVRIITATNRDLKTLQTASDFRKDLYFRLKLHHLHIPSLRERPDDIPLLTEFFVNQAASELGVPVPEIPPGLFDILSRYPFPGNVRELQGMVFDGISSPEFGKLSLDYFESALDINCYSAPAPELQAGEMIGSFEDETASFPTLKNMEDTLIEQAIAKCNGNLSQAAELLGINRVTLHRKLKRTGKQTKNVAS